MRRITWGLAAAVSALVDLSAAAALADCSATRSDAAAPDAVCEVMRLGWRVVDPGPPLWFRTNDGLPRVEVAVAGLGRPSGDDDPIRWAKSKLAGPKGAFGPFGDCRGILPDGGKRISEIDCVVPSGPDGARQGGMLVIETTAGLQVIGTVMPAGVKQTQLNLKALVSLVVDNRGAGITARAARTAIAMFTGRPYYLAPDAGIPASAIEGGYHYWNWQMGTGGMVDAGVDFVLFKNGDAWRNPGAAPQDIDPARFKEARWDDCGTWRRAPGAVGITMNGQAETMLSLNQLVRYAPAGAGERVEGRWELNKRSTMGNTSVNSSRWIALHANGRFEENRSTVVTSSFHGHSGSTIVAPAPVQSGRYRIDGYSLEVTYDDGRRDSALFYWAGDGGRDRHDMVLINGANFLGGLSR